MPARRQGVQRVIVGPDIDRLAQGIHAPEIQKLAERNLSLQAEGNRTRAENRKLRQQIGKLTRERDMLQHNLDKSKESKAGLVRQNKLLRAQLLNNGIKPMELEES